MGEQGTYDFSFKISQPLTIGSSLRVFLPEQVTNPGVDQL